MERYKHTSCCDEIAIATLIWNSPFKEQLYNIEDEFTGCMREIDWHRGAPYTWGADENDLELLLKSEKIFARKFDMDNFPEIVEQLYKQLNITV